MAVLAIDAGTTGIRAFVVDGSGTPVVRAYREFTQHFPEPGWVEHDATEIWDTTVAVLEEAAALVRAEMGDEAIIAIGITNQRETAVAWDARTGLPRHRALVWQDRRTADRCRELEDGGHLPRIRELTGLVLDPYFSASKFEWLLTEGGVEVDDDLRLGTVDSWLLWNLTGGTSDAGAVHATDPSNASRTMLYDLRQRAWSDELCDLFGVPRSALPEVAPSCGEFGRTTAAVPLGEGIPVAGIAGDQQAALFGQACLEPGMAKNTYGTGSFVLLNVGGECPEPCDGLLATVAWEVPARVFDDGDGGDGEDDPTVTHYALEGAIFVTGAAVQWLRDGLEIIAEAAEVGPLAESVPDTGGAFVVPAFTGLGAPDWDPYARGTIVGITRGTTRAHLARAVVESMAFQTRDVVEEMTRAAGVELAELRVDGGAAAMDLLLQVQADQLGVPVVRSAVAETTALGAALLAGLGAGTWSSAAELAANWRADARVDPGTDPEHRAAADAGHAMWRRAVERSLAWDRPD
ncbi:glycerol kinase GlpK [Dermatobacter hominis]|uniref:glycerol kinase GlpK n=1 Tax=Dermatobacter hominis TaxID=2884263 RepID=UPI001D109CC6|nr:glycerol kinase GlpK [Dermatobacter hominis]UDY35948.1 glycerol kinase GlpK [Dermatobacter hominis]